MRRYREDGERLVKIGNYYVRRPQAVPYHADWTEHLRDAAEALAGVVVFLTLFIGVPLLLWLVGAPK